MAFDSSFLGTNSYLDTDTGQVLTVTDETNQELEQLYEEYFDPNNPDAFDIELALAEADLRDWQKEDAIIALFVEAHLGDRVIAIPDTPPYEAYNEMQDFIAAIEDDRLYNWLLGATKGRGAFGRLKAISGQHLADQQRWYAFQEDRLKERILEWLAEVGVEPIEVPQPVDVKAEDLLELRQKLLDEVFIFVQAASRIPGVTRIALIGSLATDKVDPSDADLLVNVTDLADLKEVATLGRKLQGHTQRFRRSGEVFLADEQHHYLGRTCP